MVRRTGSVSVPGSPAALTTTVIPVWCDCRSGNAKAGRGSFVKDCHLSSETTPTISQSWFGFCQANLVKCLPSASPSAK